LADIRWPTIEEFQFFDLPGISGSLLLLTTRGVS
jgi:hypothetical protein